MSQVAAVSGATGEGFDKLRAKAREMGAKTKFSASESADAMNYMAMAGWKAFDESLVKRWLERIIVWEEHFTVELKSRLKIDIEG